MKFLFVLALVFISTQRGWSLEITSKNDEDESKKPLGVLRNYTPDPDEILGKILEQALENVHYLHKEIDNDLSRKAFNLYLERIDYGKQFLLDSDIDELKNYEKKLYKNFLGYKLKIAL